MTGTDTPTHIHTHTHTQTHRHTRTHTNTDTPLKMVAASAGGSVCPRTKPEIYSTSNGKTVVEDELLNFTVVKMRTLSHDEIINL